METYLPIFKAILSDWILITLANPLYASVLGFLVFLITAMLYSIRIASLKQKNVISEKARLEMEGMLNAELTSAKQKVEAMQDELFINTEQMKKDQLIAQNEVERAVKFEGQISTRNKQIAMVIQTLATSFDLGERPLPIMGDIKAEGLWQQHDRVITLLTTRLFNEQQAKTQLQQSYQLEAAKCAEKETQLMALQATLTTQSNDVSRLEKTLEERTSQLNQQQVEAQRVLAEALEKQLSETANTKQQLNLLEEKLSNKETAINQFEETKRSDQLNEGPLLAEKKQNVREEPIETQPLVEVDLATVSVSKEVLESPAKDQLGGISGKFKNIFAKTIEESITKKPQQLDAKKERAVIQTIAPDVPSSSVALVKEQMAGMTGKFKNMFGKAKQESIAVESNRVEIKAPMVEITDVLPEVAKPLVSPVKEEVSGLTGRFNSLFVKANQKSSVKESDVIAEVPSVKVEQLADVSIKTEKVSVTGKLKGLFGKAK